MKTLIWNCRDLNSADSPTVPYLCWLVRKFSSNILFLMETKADSSLIARFSRVLGFLSFEVCNAVGLAGGLAPFWNGSVSLNVFHNSMNPITCKIVDVLEGQNYEWKLLFLYGSPYLNYRHEVWEKVVDMVDITRDDFVICGDFNQIENLEQKWGGLTSIPGSDEFSSWRMRLRITELPFIGPRYTWCNNRMGNDRIYERLDRVYGSKEWMHKQPNAISLNLPIMVSDHSPVLFLVNPAKPKKKSLIQLEAWCFDF